MTTLRDSLGTLGVWGHLDSLPATELRPYVAHVAALGYGALWVPETVGREPFTLLGAIAQAAGGMTLGTSIASIWGHDAMTTRMAAMTLHELTGGRFVLGLGVSHPHLAQKLRGHSYDLPLTRMREYLEAYRRLPWIGPVLGEGAPTEPPIMLAALRERMLGLAATAADGAFPYLVGVERIGWMRGVLDAAAPDGRRPLLAVTLPVVLETDPERARSAARAYLAPYLRAPNYQASWEAQGFDADDWTQPGSTGLVDATVAWGEAAAVRARIAAMHAAGADHVALIPLAPSGNAGRIPQTEHLPALEALAPRT
jgi:probable F420-dependent oxidoreductase